MGARQASLFALRAKLRRHALEDRVRFCGSRVIGNNAAVEVRQGASGKRRAWWAGVFMCERQHSCPVCHAKRAAARAEELTRMQAGDAPGAWRMLTLTMHHHRGQKLAELAGLLMAAWRKTRRTRAVRVIFDRRVTASARCLEVTWSERNGWHPHLHIVLRTSEWTEEERETLSREWLRQVVGLASVATAWTETPASYISKLKLAAELAGIGKDRSPGEGLSPMQLAAAALERPELMRFWREYQAAMHGRRILELDERAKALAAAAPDVEEEETARWRVLVAGKDYRALVRRELVDPEALWLALDVCCATGADPPHELAVYLEDVTGSCSEVTEAAA